MSLEQSMQILPENSNLDSVTESGLYTIRYSSPIVTKYPPKSYPDSIHPWSETRVRWFVVRVYKSYNRSGCIQEISSASDPGVLWRRIFRHDWGEPAIATYLSWEMAGITPSGTRPDVERQGSRVATPRTLIVASARNEGIYFLEWLAYHRCIGFDHFLVYVNETSDGSEQLLRCLEDAGVLSLRNNDTTEEAVNEVEVPEPLMSLDSRVRRSSQWRAYLNAARDGVARPYDWIAFIDLDEFIIPKRHTSIKTTLSAFEDVAAVAVNWREFGSSQVLDLDKRLVLEKFVRCPQQSWHKNGFVKTIVRREQLDFMNGMHLARLRDRSAKYVYPNLTGLKTHYDPDRIYHDELQINHYTIKSRAEYALKILRGDASFSKDDPSYFNKHNWEYFASQDLNDDLDNSAQFFVPKTKMEMALLRLLPGVAEAEAEVWRLTLDQLRKAL